MTLVPLDVMTPNIDDLKLCQLIRQDAGLAT
jgi:CheY-like chemotaxis protein